MIGRILTRLLIPIALIPVGIWGLDTTSHLKRQFFGIDVLAAPPVPRTPALAVPTHPNSVPVLVYHGISEGAPTERETITRNDFAYQMALLKNAGYQTVSSDLYARFIAGEAVKLPSRPILITFDDGRLDSVAATDAILKQHGFRATMFVIASRLSGSKFHASRDELQTMQKSQRWDLELHAGRGHVEIATRYGHGSFYSNVKRDETFVEWRKRVTDDTLWGMNEMRKQFPGIKLNPFSVPFSEYGQNTEDRRLREYLLQLWTSKFKAVFVQEDMPKAPFYGSGSGGKQIRVEVNRDTRTSDLMHWLQRNAQEAHEALQSKHALKQTPTA